MAALFQTLLVSVALASVHVFAGKLRFLDVTPRSVWLSSAGGASVAYVFLHILPDLAQGQDQFLAAKTGWLANVERHVWLLSLAGLSAFYGLERLVHRSQPLPISGDPQGSVEPGVFWLHIGSFALYNLVFGYLLARRPTSVKELLFFGLAIGFHFVVNDFGLRMDPGQIRSHCALGPGRRDPSGVGSRCFLRVAPPWSNRALCRSCGRHHPECAEGGAAGTAKQPVLGICCRSGRLLEFVAHRGLRSERSRTLSRSFDVFLRFRYSGARSRLPDLRIHLTSDEDCHTGKIEPQHQHYHRPK